jgi:hypothetical protein
MSIPYYKVLRERRSRILTLPFFGLNGELFLDFRSARGALPARQVAAVEVLRHHERDVEVTVGGRAFRVEGWSDSPPRMRAAPRAARPGHEAR